jgi:hypothetical protein
MKIAVSRDRADGATPARASILELLCNQPIRCIELEIIRLTIVALGFDLKLRRIELHFAAGASFSGNRINQLCSLVVGNLTIGSCGDRCNQRQCA